MLVKCFITSLIERFLNFSVKRKIDIAKASQNTCITDPSSPVRIDVGQQKYFKGLYGDLTAISTNVGIILLHG